MIGLLQSAFAHSNHICKVLANLIEQLAANDTFSREQTI